MWVATWLGCGPGTAGVDWDVTTASDAGEDVLVGLFVLGLQETDGGVLRAVHPVGSTLTIRALPRSGQGDPGAWTARSLDPAVLDIRRQEPTGSALELRLAFPGEGDTELAVVDGAGTVIDTEVIVVREAVGADVFSWEEAQRGLVRPLDALHVAEGTDATFVVQWRTSDGTRMSGGDILAVDGPGALEAAAGFDGSSEILRLSPGPGAAGAYEVTLLAAAREIRTLPVVVHARSEVDEVSLELGRHRVSAREGGITEGTVHAVVTAGGRVLSGAEVTFAWSGASDEGDTLDFSSDAGPATEVDVCFDDVCNTFPLPAGVVGVRDVEADLSVGSCSCGHTGGAPLALGAAALAALRRRRR
jgi:MYXO-CTERM domain-containing protein